MDTKKNIASVELNEGNLVFAGYEKDELGNMVMTRHQLSVILPTISLWEQGRLTELTNNAISINTK